MGIRIVTCYAVSCDGCKEPWGDDYGPELHFDSAHDAYNEVTEGWRLKPDGTLLCPSCSCAEDCVQLGHQWTQSVHCPCQGEHPDHIGGCPTLWFCGHCDAVRAEAAS